MGCRGRRCHRRPDAPRIRERTTKCTTLPGSYYRRRYAGALVDLLQDGPVRRAREDEVDGLVVEVRGQRQRRPCGSRGRRRRPRAADPALIRCRAKSAHSGYSSKPSDRRPSRAHAITVEPVPARGSGTSWPARVKNRTRRWASASGNVAGCWPLRAHRAPGRLSKTLTECETHSEPVRSFSRSAKEKSRATRQRRGRAAEAPGAAPAGECQKVSAPDHRTSATRISRAECNILRARPDLDRLRKAIAARQRRAGLMGLGYVGLALLVQRAEAGFTRPCRDGRPRLALGILLPVLRPARLGPPAGMAARDGRWMNR